MRCTVNPLFKSAKVNTPKHTSENEPRSPLEKINYGISLLILDITQCLNIDNYIRVVYKLT